MKPTREYSKKQEKRVADSLGARRTANSGATAFDKGDVSDKYALFECKTLTKAQKSATIKKEWLLKMREEEIARGKSLSALVFDFGDGEDYYILRAADFRQLYNSWIDQIEEGGDR